MSIKLYFMQTESDFFNPNTTPQYAQCNIKQIDVSICIGTI